MLTRAVAPLLILLAAPLAAQVDATIRIGLVTHAAHAADEVAPDHPIIRPGAAASLGAAVGWHRGAWRADLGLTRSVHALVVASEAAGAFTGGALVALDVAAEAGRLVSPSGSAHRLWLLAGIGRTRWSFPELEEVPRWRWRGLVALESDLGTIGPLRGVLRLEGSRESAVFTADELPEGYARRSSWRGAVSLGIRLPR
jgi:hypothetical protein